MVELVNATAEDLAPKPPIPSMYKMIATLMLQNGFELVFGLGNNSQWIIESIQIPVKWAKHGLRYISTDDEVKMIKSGDQALARTPIPIVSSPWLRRSWCPQGRNLRPFRIDQWCHRGRGRASWFLRCWAWRAAAELEFHTNLYSPIILVEGYWLCMHWKLVVVLKRPDTHYFSYSLIA